MKAGYRDIAQALKDEWEPGARLPTHPELRERFGCTAVTVQRAMNLLVEHGHVRTEPKVGSFYVERPPHRHRVVMAFPGHPSPVVRDWRWSRQFAALKASVDELPAGSPLDLDCRFDLDPDEPGGAVKAELAQELADRRMAGLILPFTPFMMGRERWLVETGVPVVTAGNVDFRETRVVRLDHPLFIREALTWLLAQGRKRIGVLMPTQRVPGYFEPFAREFGVPARPHWFQGVDPFHVGWMRHNVEMMLHGPERPDALLITDDHLTEPAIEVLADLGVDVPGDLLVLSLWNFPLPYRGRLAIELLGFDIRDWLRQALLAIGAHRDGRPWTNPTMLRPCFAREFPNFSDRLTQPPPEEVLLCNP